MLPNGTYDSTAGSETIGLKILTGYDTASNLTSEYADADEFWNDSARANESTPVIFNTVSSAKLGITIPLLGDSHDYMVFNCTVKHDGSRPFGGGIVGDQRMSSSWKMFTTIRSR